MGQFKKNICERMGNEDFFQITAALYEDGYKSVGVLMVSSLETNKNCIMDSKFS